jgi:pSer/pThr/pTyr-binding forkhead associated (FHA) protein
MTVDEVKGTIDDPGFLIDDSGDAGGTIELNRQYILIGNDPAADIIVNDPKASDYIAEITYEQDFYILRRLNNRSRVSANKKPVNEYILADGDEIQLAERSFTFRSPDHPRQTAE